VAALEGLTMQLGFGDGWISPKIGQNTTLERLSAEVKWYRLEKLLVRLRSDGPGRPPKQALMMLKALLLQQWYGLSDADLEETLNDRMSFRRFVGLGLEEAAPDHTTLCRFRWPKKGFRRSCFRSSAGNWKRAA
jgi:transposase